MELYHSPWSEVYNHDRTNTGLVLPPVSRVPGSIALDPHPSSGAFSFPALVDLSEHREFPPPNAEHGLFSTRFASDGEIHSPVAADHGKIRAAAFASWDFGHVERHPLQATFS